MNRICRWGLLNRGSAASIGCGCKYCMYVCIVQVRSSYRSPPVGGGGEGKECTSTVQEGRL